MPEDKRFDFFLLYIKKVCIVVLVPSLPPGQQTFGFILPLGQPRPPASPSLPPKVESLYGVTRTREVYQKAIEVLPDEGAKKMCLLYAALERKLGEVRSYVDSSLLPPYSHRSAIFQSFPPTSFLLSVPPSFTRWTVPEASLRMAPITPTRAGIPATGSSGKILRYFASLLPYLPPLLSSRISSSTQADSWLDYQYPPHPSPPSLLPPSPPRSTTATRRPFGTCSGSSAPRRRPSRR